MILVECDPQIMEDWDPVLEQELLKVFFWSKDIFFEEKPAESK